MEITKFTLQKILHTDLCTVHILYRFKYNHYLSKRMIKLSIVLLIHNNMFLQILKFLDLLLISTCLSCL